MSASRVSVRSDKCSAGVDNPGPQPLIYCAEIMVLGHKKPTPTSIITVSPGVSGAEMWEDPIVGIILTSFAWRPQGSARRAGVAALAEGGLLGAVDQQDRGIALQELGVAPGAEGAAASKDSALGGGTAGVDPGAVADVDGHAGPGVGAVRRSRSRASCARKLERGCQGLPEGIEAPGR